MYIILSERILLQNNIGLKYWFSQNLKAWKVAFFLRLAAKNEREQY